LQDFRFRFRVGALPRASVHRKGVFDTILSIEMHQQGMLDVLWSYRFSIPPCPACFREGQDRVRHYDLPDGQPQHCRRPRTLRYYRHAMAFVKLRIKATKIVNPVQTLVSPAKYAARAAQHVGDLYQHAVPQLRFNGSVVNEID
jgi:hypothetical protein